MPRKKLSDKDWPIKMTEVLAGCPFNNFGHCKGFKCWFYFEEIPKSKDWACAIRETYVQVMLTAAQNAFAYIAQPGIVLGQNPDIFVSQFADTAVKAVHNLRVIAEHPTCSPSTRRKVCKSLKALADALESDCVKECEP